jgi:hypothetical protein
MDKKLKRIELVLENCEVINVEAKNILQFFTGPIKEAMHSQGDTVWFHKWVDFFQLKIKKTDDAFIWSNEGVKGERSAYDRLKIRDIANIDFIYEDGTNDYIGMPWTGSDLSNNKLEKWKETDSVYIIEWDNSDVIKKCKDFFISIKYKYIERRAKRKYDRLNKKLRKNFKKNENS